MENEGSLLWARDEKGRFRPDGMTLISVPLSGVEKVAPGRLRDEGFERKVLVLSTDTRAKGFAVVLQRHEGIWVGNYPWLSLWEKL